MKTLSRLVLAGFSISVAMLCLRGYASVAKKHVRSTPKTVVYVGGIDTNGGAGFLPLLDLSEALADHPHSRLFRVEWEGESGSYSEAGLVLYDRAHETLEYTCQGDHNAGYGLAGDYLKRAAVRDHFLFTRVSPAIITTAGAAALHDQLIVPADAFNSLSRYGCRRRTLRKRNLL